jgi:hypothetical protein
MLDIAAKTGEAARESMALKMRKFAPSLDRRIKSERVSSKGALDSNSEVF